MERGVGETPAERVEVTTRIWGKSDSEEIGGAVANIVAVVEG